MFGTNIIRKVDMREDSLLVHSLFPTIQGEGPHAGRAAVFLRLAGCSLACSWCDTEFEEGAERIDVHRLVELICDERPYIPRTALQRLCVITGGEPMRQNLAPLARRLLCMDWEVQVETAGIHWTPALSNFEEYLLTDRPSGTAPFSIVCSPKTPRINAYVEMYCTHWKYIIDADAPVDLHDGLPAYAVSQAHKQTTHRLYRPPYTERQVIYVQPLDVADVEHRMRNQARCVQLVQQFGYRLSLQQHKMLRLP